MHLLLHHPRVQVKQLPFFFFFFKSAGNYLQCCLWAFLSPQIQCTEMITKKRWSIPLNSSSIRPVDDEGNFSTSALAPLIRATAKVSLRNEMCPDLLVTTSTLKCFCSSSFNLPLLVTGTIQRVQNLRVILSFPFDSLLAHTSCLIRTWLILVHQQGLYRSGRGDQSV